MERGWPLTEALDCMRYTVARNLAGLVVIVALWWCLDIAIGRLAYEGFDLPDGVAVAALLTAGLAAYVANRKVTSPQLRAAAVLAAGAIYSFGAFLATIHFERM